jgi:hypothetical protein
MIEKQKLGKILWAIAGQLLGAERLFSLGDRIVLKIHKKALMRQLFPVMDEEQPTC